jgi:dCMP deaminase
MNRFDDIFMKISLNISSLSYCNIKKVGALIVKDGNIISFGYNGTPYGMDNCCEDNGITKSIVIHAETNAIIKAAKSGYSLDKSTLYLTLSPCIDCSKLILQSGIIRLVYLEDYRNKEGLELLNNFIKIQKYEF